MKKTLLAAFALASLAAVAQAQTTAGPVTQDGGLKVATPTSRGPMGYPGNVWGTMVYAAHAPDGFPKYRLEGVVEQGIDWRKFGDWRFNTFAGFEYVINSENKGVTPMVGVKFAKSFGGDGALDLGLRAKHGNTYLSPSGSFAGGTEKVTRVELFATYWFAWNLKK